MPESIIEIYQASDGQTQLEVIFEEDTVWLSQQQLTDLFGQTKQNISLHIFNYNNGELEKEVTVRYSLTVQAEGNRKVSRSISFYNLDVITSVEYRAKSFQAMKFRTWANPAPKAWFDSRLCHQWAALCPLNDSKAKLKTTNNI